MRHIDLFSGIGGGSLATSEVWPNIEHIFVENDPFCQQVLKKNFPNSKIYGDIRKFNSNAQIQGKRKMAVQRKQDKKDTNSRGGDFSILTGGFPCQPFSQAGKRGGKSDDRYLWPEMLRVIKDFRPRWIVGENVAGILSMAQRQGEPPVEGEIDNGQDDYGQDVAGGIIWEIINDLEEAGYTVQTFVIPACAVNAIHRRDRVWIVAHSSSERRQQISRGTLGNESKNEGRTKENNYQPPSQNKISNSNFKKFKSGAGFSKIKSEQNGNKSSHAISNGSDSEIDRLERLGDDSHQKRKKSKHELTYGRSGSRRYSSTAKDARSFGGRGRYNADSAWDGRQDKNEGSDWSRNWIEVATELCSLDDGLPVELGEFKLSKSKHREAQLKGYGNAWVPQVAIPIFQAIKEIEEKYAS